MTVADRLRLSPAVRIVFQEDGQMGLMMAIDPGNEQSGYVFVDQDYRIHGHGKKGNREVLDMLKTFIVETGKSGQVVIERVASYGMAVGANVFETCEWIGRFACICEQAHMPVDYVYRMEERMAICHSPRANDANIRRALIDRFAQHDKERGKGTKANPDFFYGFAADAWSAFAVAVTWLDRKDSAK